MLEGGSHLYYGALFRLSRNHDGPFTEKILHNFTGGQDGAIPNGLIFDAAGNLFGVTEQGGNGTGAQGDGVIFEVAP